MPRKVWVLDTETKGTGAQMVPLDDRRKPSEVDAAHPQFVVTRSEPEPRPAEPRAPRRFRVVDVMTRQVLAENVGIREAAALVRSRRLVDVNVSVWEAKGERWRLLTHAEQRLLRDGPAAS